MKSREKILRLLSENNTLTTATHASVGGERTQKKDKSCDLSCLVAGRGLEPLTSGL